MKSLLCAKAARADDQHTIQIVGIPEQTLIERVAQSILNVLQNGNYDLSSPCILCGAGNNGADGFALAGLLKQLGCNVSIVYPGSLIAPASPKQSRGGEPAKEAPDTSDKAGTPDTEKMSASCRDFYLRAIEQDIPILTDKLPQTVSVYVDAIIGLGLRGAMDSKIEKLIGFVNRSGVPVVSVDIPSGVYTDTGEVAAQAICATETVTVQSTKIGLMVYPGAAHAGKVTVIDVGIEPDPLAPTAQCQMIEEQDLPKLLPARPARSCKGTFGRVLVIAGSPGMAGAAYLAGMGAYRAGAGIVEIFTPAQNRVILQELLPEAVLTCYAEKKDMSKLLKAALTRADAIVLGCGLGQSKLSASLIAKVLKTASKPLVLDADALNLIAKKPALLKHVKAEQKKRTVITPHAAEAARLLGAHVEIDSILGHTYTSAQTLYTQFGVNVLLKDAHSVLYTTDSKYYVNGSGSTALSTAGSGDILAGVIGGLAAAQTNKMPMGMTAALAAYLHGKAGEQAELAIGARAAMARDILDGLAK